MKNTGKITFCAIMSALAVVIMLTSYFPYLTYAIPAIAGLCVMIVLIETNYKWAALSYIASAVIILLVGEMESKLLYLFLFGYYPIVKSLIEKINKRYIEFILKLLLFNIVVLAVYGIFSNVFSLSLNDFGVFKKFGVIFLLVLANVVFVFYDVALAKMSIIYIELLHPRINRLLKRGK